MKAVFGGPGCSYQIPDPHFCPSQIPDLGSPILDPKTATKEMMKKISCPTFFVATNITKLRIILL
jgi:hypothetical protein